MTNTATQYRAYKGRNIDQMPLMLSLGVNPLSAVEFMRNRDAIFTQLRDVYANVSDLVAYGGKGASDEIKMILTMDNQGRITESGRKTLELINPKQERNSSAIVLSDELYDGFNGANVIKLSRKNLKKYGVNKRLTGPQVLNHPGWRVLLRHPDASKKHAKMRTWCIGRLVLGSLAYGWLNLDHDYGHFVDIAPNETTSEASPSQSS